MKIYILFLDKTEYTDKSRKVVKSTSHDIVEVHRTFDGARNAATSYGFNMNDLKANDMGYGIISWPGYIKENGPIDEWMEIVEDELMD